MLLTIDAGNTQTVIGLYATDEDPHPDRRADDGLLDHWRLATEAKRTSDETAVLLQGLLGFGGYSLDDIDGMAVSSGVPRVTATLSSVVTVARYLSTTRACSRPEGAA